MSEFLDIPIEKIRQGKIALRPVDTENPEYIQLRDSIKEEGEILHPINVMRRTDKETNEEYFELLDGLQRFTAAKQLRFSHVPTKVVSREDDLAILRTQLVANKRNVTTKPAEYADQLQKMLKLDPMLTEAELARQLSEKPQWIRDRLRLNSLCDAAKRLVDDGKITLSNAKELAKLPDDEQGDFLQRATTEQAGPFGSMVAERRAEIRNSRVRGEKKKPNEFIPTPTCRKIGEVKEAFTLWKEKGDTSVGARVVEQNEAKSALEGFYAGVSWALQMDRETVAIEQQKFLDQLEKRKAERERRKAEAQAAREAEAVKVEAELKEEAVVAVA